MDWDWRLAKYWTDFFASLWWGLGLYIYIQTKIRTYGDNVYTNFHGLIVPEDVELEYFTTISIDSLLVYESKH